MYDIRRVGYGLRVAIRGKLSADALAALEQELSREFRHYRSRQQRFSVLMDVRHVKADRSMAKPLKALLSAARQSGMSQLALVVPKLPFFVLSRLDAVLNSYGISRKQVFFDRTIAEEYLTCD